jgi:transposase InsO family protein
VLNEHDLPIAPSTYHAHKARPVSDADGDDAHMANVALDVWRTNRSLYGADKLATAMRKAGYTVGRDQVARLMGIVGIEGVRRGKHRTITTIRDAKAAHHPDLIRRAWSTPTRPDLWWVADFTYVWTLEGFVYTSFVTDVCSRRILGWRTSSSKSTPLVMSALEQALFTRRRTDARFTSKGLVFHSDAGSPRMLIAGQSAAVVDAVTTDVTPLPRRLSPPAAPWSFQTSSARRRCPSASWQQLVTDKRGFSPVNATGIAGTSATASRRCVGPRR